MDRCPEPSTCSPPPRGGPHPKAQGPLPIAPPGGSPHLVGLRGPGPHWGAALGRVCTEHHLKGDEGKVSRTHHTGQTDTQGVVITCPCLPANSTSAYPLPSPQGPQLGDIKELQSHQRESPVTCPCACHAVSPFSTPHPPMTPSTTEHRVGARSPVQGWACPVDAQWARAEWHLCLAAPHPADGPHT